MAWREAFRREMEAVLGEEAPAFFSALEEEPCKALRLLPDRGDRSALLALLAPFSGDKIPFADDAWFVKAPGAGTSVLHAGGAIYLQDGAAMAPAAAVTVRPDDRILDLCAAPGGKSVALGARLGRRNRLL